uniref:Uncharacterized protein n=1 Tax=Globodera rostochiensis TaxID=31243 RepID=A0A914GRM3_GLORO
MNVKTTTTNVRQKLNVMETALARLTASKRQLNSSAEKARSELRQAIDQHITALRDREHKLLQEIEHVRQNEEEHLSDQMEKLNQTIGSCKFMVEKVHLGNEMETDEPILPEFIQRINLAELMSPSDCVSIVFSNGALGANLSQQIASFGHIYEECADIAFQQPTQQKTVDTSDDWTMAAHTHRKHSNSTTFSGTAQADGQPNVVGQVEAVRDRVTSTSLSVASFDVISAMNGGADHFGTSAATSPVFLQLQPQQLQHPAFAAHFNELNGLPTEYWLRAAGAGPKKAVSTVPSHNQQQQPQSFIPNMAEMFSKMRMDSNEKQQHPQQHQLLSSLPVDYIAKNQQPPKPRKRSVFEDSDQLKQKTDSETINWAMADLSNWLKASKHPSSDSCATVINSVLASTPDKWLAKPKFVKTPFAATVASFEAFPQPPDVKISRQSHPPTVFNKNRQHHSNTSNFANLSLRLNGPGVKEEEHLMQSAQQFRAISESVDEALNRLATLFEDKTVSQPIEKLADTNTLKHYPFSAAVDNVFDWNVPPKHCADTAAAAVVPMPMDTSSTVVVVVDDPADDQQQQQQLKVKTPLALPTDPSYWLKQYPPPKQNRPMNEMAEDLCCWESVLGWKSILEKIHGSGEDGWLAPSSRAIKNEAGAD